MHIVHIYSCINLLTYLALTVCLNMYKAGGGGGVAKLSGGGGGGASRKDPKYKTCN